jgi:hypothetical protein
MVSAHSRRERLPGAGASMSTAFLSGGELAYLPLNRWRLTGQARTWRARQQRKTDQSGRPAPAPERMYHCVGTRLPPAQRQSQCEYALSPVRYRPTRCRRARYVIADDGDLVRESTEDFYLADSALGEVDLHWPSELEPLRSSLVTWRRRRYEESRRNRCLLLRQRCQPEEPRSPRPGPARPHPHRDRPSRRRQMVSPAQTTGQRH